MAEEKGVGEVEKKESTATAGATTDTNGIGKKKRRGFLARIWNGIFRLHGDDFEKRLKYISKEEATVLSRMKRRSLTWRRMIRQLIIFSVIFEVLFVLIIVQFLLCILHCFRIWGFLRESEELEPGEKWWVFFFFFFWRLEAFHDYYANGCRFRMVSECELFLRSMR